MDDPFEQGDSRTDGTVRDRRAERRESRRATHEDREASPEFGGPRDFRSALFLLVPLDAVFVLAIFYSAKRTPAFVAWVGIVLFSICAIYLTLLLIRATYRLVRTGTTQKRDVTQSGE
jgi:hypothetical protein